MLSPVTIESVKERMDIEEVVSDYLSLKKKGRNLWACCPFHDEKTPSFSVAPDKNIYKCFGCGKAGDGISFIMEHDGFSYVEAIKHLAKKYGIEIVEDEATDEQLQQQNERESLYIILNFAKDHFHKNILENEEGRSIGLSYLRERGYNESIINKFQLGYAVDDWDHLTKEALENKFNVDILEKAGLIIKKEEEKFYDRFRGRVMFPIHDLAGKVVAFGGRTLKKDKKVPKYINSPETEVYHKSNVLYGIHQARQSIRNEDNCYLVEGYTDVISLHLAGIENVVASSGTSLTDEQVKLISRFTKNITVLYDGDVAGMKASLRGIDMILAKGLNVKVLMFPDGEDPDSYSQKVGSSAFKEFLDENVKDFIHFKTSLYARESASDPVKRAASAKEVIKSIAIIPDNVQRAIYLKEASDLLQLSESVLLSEMNKILIQEKRQKKSDFKKEKEAEDEFLPEAEKSRLTDHNEIIALQEKETLRLLLNFGHHNFEDGSYMFDYIKHELDEIEFINQKHKAVFELYVKHTQEEKVPDVNEILKEAHSELKSLIADLISDRYEISNKWKDKYEIIVPEKEDIIDNLVYSNLIRLKLRIIQKLLDQNKDKLKESKDEDEQMQLLNIHQNLKKSEIEIAKMLGIVVAR